MNFRQLQYFVGIVSAGSLSRGARELHVAQSALSQHLAGLEAELGVQLLVRGPAGVTLTESGQSLYRDACAILRQLEIAKHNAIHVGSRPSGPVAVGIPSALAPILGFPLIKAVLESYPDIQLDVVDNQSSLLSDQVQNGRLDVAILFVDSREQRLEVRQILSEELFYLTILRGAEAIDWNDVAKRPLLLPGRTSGIREIVRTKLTAAGMDLETVGEIDSKQTLIRATAAGLSNTILPWAATYGDENAKDLAFLSFRPEPLRRPISLCFPKAIAKRPATEAIVACLVSCITTLVTSGDWRGVTLV